MTTMWKSVYGEPAPREVQAEVPAYPGVDSDGDRIYENTHFLDEQAAWERHEREHLAGVLNAGVNVRYLRGQLAIGEMEAATAALHLANVKQAHDARWATTRNKPQPD